MFASDEGVAVGQGLVEEHFGVSQGILKEISVLDEGEDVGWRLVEEGVGVGGGFLEEVFELEAGEFCLWGLGRGRRGRLRLPGGRRGLWFLFLRLGHRFPDVTQVQSNCKNASFL
jgi:hypothetical protein